MSVRKKKSFFRENLSLKLISLILAILLELYFYSPDNSARVTLPASIEVRGVPLDLTIVRPLSGERGIPARIELKGPRPLIEQAKNSSHTFFVDYPNDGSLVFTSQLDRKQLWLPAGVELVDLLPSAITVELERVLNKRVPIIAQRNGELPEGYALDGIFVTPDSVMVNGPEREIRGLQAIGTEQIDLTSITTTQRMKLPLLRPGNLVLEGTQMVDVELRISPIPGERTLNSVPIELLAPKGFAGSVEPSRVLLQLVGPKVILDKLQEQDIHLVADVQTLTEGKHEVKPTATLPAGISIAASQPAAVTVSLLKSESQD